MLLVSRSGIKDQRSQQAVDRLRAEGVEVIVARADVTNAKELKDCIGGHCASLPPLRGVVHAAAALDDKTITGLTPEHIHTALAAKALGAWNLHAATFGEPLDFFVLYSSATTAFGNPGQAGYVAANCMLETLAHWRRRQKLPASVIERVRTLNDALTAGHGKLLRLSYAGNQAYQPILSRLIRDFGLDVSILNGQVDEIQDQTFGFLAVYASGDLQQLQAAIAALRASGVQVQEVNTATQAA